MIKVFAFLILAFTQRPALACEPAHVTFDGTPFAEQTLQIENDKIYFYRGTPQELAVYYRAKYKKWCYEDAAASESHPKRGCLTRKVEDGKRALLINGQPVKNFVLRDAKKHAVATLNVIGKMLTANFVGTDGKALGKRAVFTSVTAANGEILEARGYNCPNPKFLSCAGGELISGHEPEEGLKVEPIKVADLSKRLGHFRLSCGGITEHAADGETKRAPSTMEPGVH